MGEFYKVSKKSMLVLGTHLMFPSGKPRTKQGIVHSKAFFWIPIDVWEDWKFESQRQANPENFIQDNSEYNS